MRARTERCSIDAVFANDIDDAKEAIYRDKWGNWELVVGDVRELTSRGMPDVDLGAAASPCVDVFSRWPPLGLERQPFRRAVRLLLHSGRDGRQGTKGENDRERSRPSHRKLGRDYRQVTSELRNLGYGADCLCLNAAEFVSQSRFRLIRRSVLRSTNPATPLATSERADVRGMDEQYGTFVRTRSLERRERREEDRESSRGVWVGCHCLLSLMAA